MQLTPGGTNGVIRRILRARLIDRKVSAQDCRDVGLEIARRGESLMTTGVGGWDPRLLERLARMDEERRGDMMELLAQIAEATEHRADVRAETALQVNAPAAGVPVPVQWG